MSKKDWTEQDSFCPAPWVHAHIDAEGWRRLCCISKRAPASLAKEEFSSFWNSDYMKSIRQQMMQGKLPTDCQSCIVSNRQSSYKDDLKNRYKDYQSSIFTGTKADGTSSVELVYLDYRSHGCNLKCKTCGPDSSSAWLRHALANEKKWENIFRSGDLKSVEASVKDSLAESEFLTLVRSESIRHIYFAGGEPLLSKAHDEALDFLISSGRSRNVRLYYNTNLTAPTKSIEKWLKKLRTFQYVGINCSIDGSQEVTQYIRTGMDFRKFNENLKLVLEAQDSRGDFQTVLDATITSLLLLDLVPFSRYVLQCKVPVVSKLMIGNSHRGAFLRCEFLPREFRKKLIDGWKDFYNSRDENEQRLLKNLKENLDLAESVDQFSEGLIQEAITQAVTVDQAFHATQKFQNFLSQDSDVHRWWQSLTGHKRHLIGT